ncbi:unnamed protein product [Medioppia subpectinata]|uniref:C2H2-type domain-containing protein n=1 Tax=Medioppia subpectinata TaxID=1979941 RepID=A0A7R9KP71_9ACAR|nr:unnamed protein product [Medioppia subpectinata]CAG2107253.1 unnamed protein product [Medioppia subpectinata]
MLPFIDRKTQCLTDWCPQRHRRRSPPETTVLWICFSDKCLCICSHSLTYESIIESFVRQKSFKCHYDGCDKGFATQSRLDSHISRRHAVEDNTQSGEPIGESSHVRHQSLSEALDDRQQIPSISTTETSLPLTITTTTTTSSADSQSVDIKYNNLITSCDAGDQSRSRAPNGRQHMPTITTTSLSLQPLIITTSTSRPDRNSSDITDQSMSTATDVSAQKPEITDTGPTVSAPTIITTTTSSPDSQLVDITSDNDSDSDIELIGRVPAPKRPARNRSPVDIKLSLINYKPLVPNIVNKAPETDIKVTSAGNELNRDFAPGVQKVRRRESPAEPRAVATNTTTTSVRPKKWLECPNTGCGKKFPANNSLHKHLERRCKWRPPGVGEPVTTTDRPSAAVHECPDCRHTFKKRRQLHRHRQQRRCQSGEPLVNPCPRADCDKTFNTRKQLQQHLKYGHRKCDKPPAVNPVGQPVTTAVSSSAAVINQCPECWQTFKKPRQLYRHRQLRCQPGASELVANLCPRADCGKTFTNRRLLHKHVKNHRKYDKPKPLIVNRPPMLETREVITCSPMRYLCRHVGCHQGFTDQQLLYAHVQAVHVSAALYDPSASVHPADRHRCSRCDNTFVSMRALQDHQMLAHR